MKSRTYLDELEDMNVTISHLIYKGKPIYEVARVLEKRGVPPERIDNLIKSVSDRYHGINKIICSPEKHYISFFLDIFAYLLTVVWSVRYGLGEQNKEYALLFLVFVFILLHIIPEYLTGQTIGKFFTSTIIVDENGDKPSLRSIIIRNIVKFIPSKLIFLYSLVTGNEISPETVSKTYVVNKNRLHEI